MISETRHSITSNTELAEAAPSHPPSIASHRPIGQVLVRRGWVVVLITALCAGGAFAYLKKTAPMFTASARIYVQQVGPHILSDATTNANMPAANYLNTQCELIHSLNILALACGKVDAPHLRTFKGVYNVVGTLKENLSVEVGKKDDIITISLDSPSAQEAASIVNAVVNSYVEYSSSQKQNSAESVLKILQAEKDRREQDEKNAMAAIENFRQKAGPFATDGKARDAIAQALQSITDAYTQAKLARVEAAARLGERHPTYVAALRREEQYKSEMEGQQYEVSKFDARMLEYSQLQAGLARANSELDLINKRIKDVDVNENTGTALNIQVIEQAIPPDAAAHPKKTRTMVTAGISGLLLGLVLAFLLDASDDRLRTIPEAASLRLPVLSVIPKMGSGRNAVTAGRAVRLEPGGQVAEAFRALRSGIEYGPPAKTVLITSPTCGDGKSTTSSNLAIVLAMSGRRVLLIDADLRQPKQHEIWETGAREGLSAVVETGADVRDVIVFTGVKGLDLLPAGHAPANPAALVDSDAFTSLLSKLRDEYDYIIVDSAPALAVTDSRLLGAVCDVTVLVLRADRTTRRAASDARDALKAFGAGLLGVVVNGGPVNRHGNYGNYYAPRPRLRPELQAASRNPQLPAAGTKELVKVVANEG